MDGLPVDFTIKMICLMAQEKLIKKEKRPQRCGLFL